MKTGTWPEHCEQRAFVAGAAWWQFQKHGSTMYSSERDEAEQEAIKRYGEPDLPPMSADEFERERERRCAESDRERLT